MLEPPETAIAPLRCPTCRAEQPPANVCRRCRCDLSLLRAVLDEAAFCGCGALRALAAGDVDGARRLAERAFDLDPVLAHRRLLAVCALLQEDFAAAARLAHTNRTHAVRRADQEYPDSGRIDATEERPQ